MEFLNQHWEMLLAAIFFIVWLVRLEAKVEARRVESLELGKKADKMEVRVDGLESAVMEELRAQGKALARIEGYLKIQNNA